MYLRRSLYFEKFVNEYLNSFWLFVLKWIFLLLISRFLYMFKNVLYVKWCLVCFFFGYGLEKLR